MLEKQITYDLQITEFGIIQVRQITRIMEDGNEIAMTYHRSSISPGDDYSAKDDRTKAIADVVHTPEVIAAYQEIIKD